MATVSGESSRRSASATTPSFICSRTAIGSHDGGGRAGVTPAARRGERGWRAGLRATGSYPGVTTTRSRARPQPARCRGERLEQLVGTDPQLLADDRCRGLDDQRPVALEAERAARRRRPRARAPPRPRPTPRPRAPSAAAPPARAPAPRPGGGRRPGAPGAGAGTRGSSKPRAGLMSVAAHEPRAGGRRRPRLGIDAPRRPGRAQGRVEVVEGRRRHEGLGQRRDPPHEVGPAGRVELREDVVEEQQRRAAVERGEQVELGELEGQDRRALLAPRGEGREVPAVELEGEVVAVGADERRAVPELLLGRLREAPGERLARRLARLGRGVRHVREAGARPRPGRSRRAPPASGPASSGEEPLPRVEDRRPRTRAAWRPRTAAGRGVACSSRMARRRWLRCVRVRPYADEVRRHRPGSAGRRARRAPSVAAPAGRRRGASPPGRRRRRGGPRRSAAARRGTPLTRIRLRPPAGPSRDERHVDLRGAAGVAARRPSTRANGRLPADHLGVGPRPVRRPARQQDDGLEEARLAGGVRAPDEVRARPERRLERVVGAEARRGGAR